MFQIKRLQEKIAGKNCLGLKFLVTRRRGIARKLTRTLRKVAKVNLMKLLNQQTCTKAKIVSTKLKHNEIIEIRKKKVKEEFNISTPNQGNSSSDDKENFNPNSTAVRCIEFSTTNDPSSNKKLTLRQQLMKFATKYKPMPDMFEDLFNLMRSNGLKISRTPETLFDKNFEVLKLPFGNYLNIGVERSIKNYFRPSFIRKPMALVTSSDDFIDISQPADILLLDIAVNLVKSKVVKKAIVPQCLVIMGRINCQVFDDPFVIGIYYGSFPTPTIANEILRPFVEEVKSLETKDLIIEGNQSFRVKINAFLCDPLSHSLVTCTSLPNTSHGCKKCNQRGIVDFETSIANFPMTMKLPTVRSDDDFKFLLDNEHHLGLPILNELNVGLVSQFALDYKIVICKGVMKHLMNLWKTGKLDYRLNPEVQQKISRDLSMMAPSCPREMSRKELSLEELSKWSARDWNEFLLYYSPIALKSRMPQRYYVHFLYLHLAMRILMSSEASNAESNSFILGQLLNTFLADFVILYGNEHVDYNIHNLQHFEEIQLRLGSLKNLNGFVYENQIAMIDTFIETSDEINLEEIGERLIENSNNMVDNKINELVYTTYPHINQKGELIFKNFTITIHEPDNHVIMRDGVMRIEGIINDMGQNRVSIIGRRYEKVEVMFQAPLSSQRLLLVSSLSPLYTFYLSDIVSKAVKIDHPKDGIFICPLIT